MPVLTENSPGAVPLAAFTPLSFLKRHTLPVATYFRNPAFTQGLDVNRPILLFSCYTSKKVQASSLKLQRDGTFTRVGPSLVIPNTYSGWFSLITTDGQTAPCYSSIEEVICAKISFFLTRQDLTGYIIKDEDPPGRISYKRTVIQAGNVLKILGVYEDLNKKATGVLRKNSSEIFSGATKYAQCLNFQKEIVYVPLAANGKFYATAQKSNRSHTKVYLMSQLLKNFKFPITVKLVCGYMPKSPCSFTGIIALEKTYQEDVILACTMTSKATASFFEMEVESNFLLSPVQDPMFSKSPIYLKTLSYCQDEAEAWQKQIKVTHSVTEKRTRSLTRSLSDKFSDPLSSIRSSSFPINSENQENRPTRGKFGLAKAKLWESFLEKDPKKKADKKQRRLSKQNTYVFQLVKRHRILRKDSDNYSGLGTRRSHSFDNLEYCQVQDRLHTHKENEESSEESIYAEIAEPPPKKEKCDEDYIYGETSEIKTVEDTQHSPNSEEDLKDPDFTKSKAYTECDTLVLPKSSEKSEILPPLKEVPSPKSLESFEEDSKTSSSKCIVKGEAISVINIESTNSSLTAEENSEEKAETPKNETKEIPIDTIANKSRIVMRGNTVVIRVKDTCESRPSLTENNVDSVFRVSNTIETDDLKSSCKIIPEEEKNSFKIKIVTSEHCSDSSIITNMHHEPISIRT